MQCDSNRLIQIVTTVRPKEPSGVELGGRPRVGAFIPQCDSDGRYRPLQCHGSTGHCWCVDSSGQERAGTRTPPGTAPKDLSIRGTFRPKTYCEQHRDSVQTTSPEGYPIPGVFVPQCDDNGQYRPLQCHGSSGHCWCVDSRGQERPGTRTPPGTPSTECVVGS
uniref:Thyroglobulin type-1 domain-containing protein n=1 Tax=Lates calcarifer TaxID=8187 RepID=A0A4W6BYQ7_LATCA